MTAAQHTGRAAPAEPAGPAAPVGSLRGRARCRRGAVRSLLAAAAATAAAAVLALGASPAAAHTELLGVAPGPGKVVAEGTQVTVTLTFSEAIDPAFATVVVVDAAEQVAPAEPVRVNGAEVVQAVQTLAPGDYDIRYRVVSADGHPVDGESGFSVQAAPQPTASPAPAPTPTEAVVPAPTDSASPDAAAPESASPEPASPEVGATALTGGTTDGDGGSALTLSLGAAALAVAVGGGALAARRRSGPKSPHVDG